MKWFLYGGDLRHEIVDRELNTDQVLLKKSIQSILIHSFPMDAFPTKRMKLGTNGLTESNSILLSKTKDTSEVNGIKPRLRPPEGM